MNKIISQRPSTAQIIDGRAFPGLRCAPPGAIFHHPSGVNFEATRSFLESLATASWAASHEQDRLRL